METFRARVRTEGSKQSSILVTVPVPIARRLMGSGWKAPGWLRVTIAGYAPSFVFGRWPPSRPCLDFTLTARTFSFDLVGTELDVAVESAEPYRAREWTDREGFDWLPLVDIEHYFPTESLDGRLSLHNKYEEPFVMKRVTPVAETYRLLGLYQAEGSKGKTAVDFSMGSTNAALVRYTTELLTTWGLGPDRQYIEILYKTGGGATERAEAEKLFGDLGRVAAVREHTRGEAAVILHVQRSKPLLRLTRSALAKVFAGPFPTEVTALAYALGWLDGDGFITITRQTNYTFELRFAGYEDEQAVALRGLQQAFGWTRGNNPFGGIRAHTGRTLALHEAAQLAVAGAFRFSMSRARLIYALDERLKARSKPLTTGSRGRTLTTDASAALAQRIFNDVLADEAKALRHHKLAAEGFITNTKGLAYPLDQSAVATTDNIEKLE